MTPCECVDCENHATCVIYGVSVCERHVAEAARYLRFLATDEADGKVTRLQTPEAKLFPLPKAKPVLERRL